MMASSSASIRYYILGLLAQQPMSGYDIKRFLKNLSWLIGSPSFGSLYPALRSLLGDGLVNVDAIPRNERQSRKIYTITETGHEVLREWVEQPIDPKASLKAFVMRLLLASNFSHTGLVSHLHQRRSQVASHKAAIQQIITTMDNGATPEQYLALDYGLSIATAEMAWLDKALSQLAQETPFAKTAD
jgi:DNA-binding PadR family transcriptional regulator